MNDKYYANVTFVFYRTTISTLVPVSDAEVDYEQVAMTANLAILQDWDINALQVCQDYAVEIGEW